MEYIKRFKKVVQVFLITGKYLRHLNKTEVDFNNLKALWAQEILNHFKIDLQIKGSPLNQVEPCLFVGNHISYLDIAILFYSCPEIAFVSKKEVKAWPIFGKIAEKIQTIFVERNSNTSRALAKSEIAKTLLERKQKIAIFPSGTTSIDPACSWKKGAFEIAENNDIWVQPFRIHYTPLRAAAYIGKDNFLIHMYQLFKLKKIKVTIEFHTPVKIKNSIVECNDWKKWSEGLLDLNYFF